MNRRVVLIFALMWFLFVQSAWAQEGNLSDAVESSAAATSTTIYLPFVASQFPPETPQLNAIANPENDGNYAISWLGIERAERYVLHEATDAGFVSATVLYEGPSVSYDVVAHTTGAYYYRVKATNFIGDSGWSNVQTANVLPPTIFPSIADASVIQAAPAFNTGRTIDMWVGYDHCQPGRIARSLMHFNLADIPPGTAIDQAQLHLHLYGSCDLTGRPHTVVVRAVSEDWQESSVTWNTQPTTANETFGSAIIQSRSWGWYTIDMTTLVREWVDGARLNQGLMLLGPESSGDDSAMLSFLTRNAAPSYVPYLEITYTGAATVATAQQEPRQQFWTTAPSTKDLIGVASGSSDPAFAWTQQTGSFDEEQR